VANDSEANGSSPLASSGKAPVRRVLPLALAVVVGLATGIGSYTFRYAEGLSYLSTDPKACVNCHIMRPEYDAWQKSSHHQVAVCVDCHLPHATIAKYLIKAENGWRHGKMFTLQNFSEPIDVKAHGRAIRTATRPGPRCAPSSAANATSSTTARERCHSHFPGAKA
jgi:cytochrome c nitrite reductase small subunit